MPRRGAASFVWKGEAVFSIHEKDLPVKHELLGGVGDDYMVVALAV